MSVNKRVTSQRSCSGSLGTLLLCAVILAVFIVSVLAVDFAHMLVVKNELQNSTDAGALAGAQVLWTNPSSCFADALAVTAMNTADGRAVSNSSYGTSVTANVTVPSGVIPGDVQVDASMVVNHLFASIIGRPMDTISATSVAGTSGKLQKLNQGQGFPLAVSLDTVPRNDGVDGTPLNQRRLGDTVEFYLNSQQVKNTAFTSFTNSTANANYVGDAVEMALGLTPLVPGFIPACAVGESINLTNGVLGPNILAGDLTLQALTQPDRILILPVIMGDPAFNRSSPVVGFIGLQVTAVSFGSHLGLGGSGRVGGVVETITGRLVSPQANGVSGPIFDTGDTVNNAALDSLVLGPIQLIR